MSNQIKICPFPIVPPSIPCLHPPKLVAIAEDAYEIPKTHPFPDYQYLPLSIPAPKYGQDFTFGYNRPAPWDRSVGSTEAELKPKMRELLNSFAKEDTSGMATRLFDRFLAKQNQVTYFEDASLNTVASRHENIIAFCKRALSSPISGQPLDNGKIRIHQALKRANWDINKIIVPTDLGAPAFNKGKDTKSTLDFKNGLAVMINGVQHVYVIAKYYHYNPSTNMYFIALMFVFYDVFGLDDDDLKETGVVPIINTGFSEQVGITAWWQLQHQHGYAPLVTRTVVHVSHMVPAE